MTDKDHEDWDRGEKFCERWADICYGPEQQVGALVRLVREALPMVFSLGDHYAQVEAETNAWAAEARALVGAEPGKEST